MSARAANGEVSFYGTTIGKKAVMAVTGLILFGFVVAHVVGNLSILGGAEKINAYSALLHGSPGLLWGARSVLIAAVVLHVRAALQLYALRSAARPVAYAKKVARVSTAASRFMLWSGYALGAFIVFHILHFTTGTVHSDFKEGDVFHNVTSAFHNPVIAAVYVVAMAFLAMHLFHGLFSLSQSLGVSHPRWSSRIRTVAAVASIAVAGLFALIPVAVFASLVK